MSAQATLAGYAPAPEPEAVLGPYVDLLDVAFPYSGFEVLRVDPATCDGCDRAPVACPEHLANRGGMLLAPNERTVCPGPHREGRGGRR